ncbi:hypothetical protein BOTBODRAFT_181559 [Botryobasidium botryosum FD-172 SS1]|uniref:Uncharacterized protein n=1 Tax=Botryobasidium botryosum (strain FD-172 SS1) TaxID=930990 RepID=A0A067M4I5_BOTB1|nr:hypothetical protein BOTBODRAFT_181559 [Botryobasidium botryosum FD-172 SS1]
MDIYLAFLFTNMSITPGEQTDPNYPGDGDGDGDMPGLLPVPDSDSESDDLPALLAPSDSDSELHSLPCCEAEAEDTSIQPATSTSPSLFLSMDANFRVQCRHMRTTETAIVSYDVACQYRRPLADSNRLSILIPKMHCIAHQVEMCSPDKANGQAEDEEGYGADMEGEEKE